MKNYLLCLGACVCFGCGHVSSSVETPAVPSEIQAERMIEQNTQLTPEQKRVEMAKLRAMRSATPERASR